MIRFLYTLAAVLLIFTAAYAQEDLFNRAQAAYDDGRYGEAAMLYEKMIADGFDNPEIHYNLGNACFKNSELPNAVLHYRKASYDLPRDPDIQANLHFALNAAGAAETIPSFIDRFFSSLSMQEWIITGTGGYLLLCAGLLVLLFVRKGRRQTLKFLFLPLFILAASFMGWRHWNDLRLHPEWVVTNKEATALFSPVEGSTAHFKLPMAALVKQRSSHGPGWIEVEYDGKRGWLKQDYIDMVSP
ncbi:tetratricopeptide repeat protein [Verrucomicrobia bacterium S94]|nr:tetratricopeptide repeat protein [Verrucomicrobia bacterium S94]